VAEVVVAILEDEDVDPYVDVDLIEVDIVPLRRAPGNIGIVDIVITSLKSTERNLVNLKRHNYLSQILLPYVVLLRSPPLLIRALQQLYCHRRCMIDSDN